MNSLRCPGCGHAAIDAVGPLPQGWSFAGRMLSEPWPKTDLLACRQCRLQFRFPAPTVDELSSLYQQGHNKKWEYENVIRADWTETKKLLDSITAPAKIVDVGCWDGQFPSLLADNWERYGIEINGDAAQAAEARGVRMIAKSLEHIQGYEGYFDAVTAFDVIEHVHNPAKLADDMVRLAKPGGLVILGTGDTDSASWRLMGSRYWYCTNPEHLAFIGQQWCRWFARERGLDVARLIRYSHAPTRSLGRKVAQTALNLVYRFAPGIMRQVRKRGFGRLDVQKHPEWSDVPPNWVAARDHLLAVFQKPAA